MRKKNLHCLLFFFTRKKKQYMNLFRSVFRRRRGGEAAVVVPDGNEEIRRSILADPRLAPTRLGRFLRQRIHQVRAVVKEIPVQRVREDEEFRDKDQVWGRIVDLVGSTYEVLCSPEILRLAMDRPFLTGIVIQWLCLTGRQPTSWEDAFRALPDDVQETFLRRFIVECERLTNHTLSWIDPARLRPVIRTVFHEFMEREDVSPLKSLPEMYRHRLRHAIAMTDKRPQTIDRLTRRVHDGYLRMIDRNILTVARFLRIVPTRPAPIPRKPDIEWSTAHQRATTPVSQLHKTFLHAVPTATLKSVYEIADEEQRLRTIFKIRTYQAHLKTRKKKHLMDLMTQSGAH